MTFAITSHVCAATARVRAYRWASAPPSASGRVPTSGRSCACTSSGRFWQPLPFEAEAFAPLGGGVGEGVSSILFSVVWMPEKSLGLKAHPDVVGQASHRAQKQGNSHGEWPDQNIHKHTVNPDACPQLWRRRPGAGVGELVPGWAGRRVTGAGCIFKY